MTKVVHCKKEPYDVYIGRPSKFGNPFIIGKDGTREDVVRKFEEWFIKQPNFIELLKELKDKTIACFCSPQSCHGDIYVKLIKEYLE